MDRGAWWAAVHRVAKSQTTEQLTLPNMKRWRGTAFMCLVKFFFNFYFQIILDVQITTKIIEFLCFLSPASPNNSIVCM